MEQLPRYLRLMLALARFGLLREFAFRGNFLAKVFVEVLWLAILLAFYQTIFARTTVVAEWTEAQYLFFVGCYFALEGLIEALFLENCNEFADLVRSGDLDFFLLQPIDEQFLISCRKVDWSTLPNVFMGTGVMILALWQMDQTPDLVHIALFLVLFACSLAIAYSFLLMLTSSAVWLVRNQSLFEMWWLFTSLMRYPREIFRGTWATPVGWFFTFIIPVMLVINVPARTMVKVFEPWIAVFTAVAAVLLLLVSRRVFRKALRHYRSASS
ncbi:MAG: ABC-2 family transporter protein [Gemmataceae bacterium]|nr:ABC-2 family transporter protein [Gemmataceae bacterium]